jgi:hypothetical protein
MVRCADCGFLSLRHRETRELREAEADYRTTGEIPPMVEARWGTSTRDPAFMPRPAYEAVPLCFPRKINFADLLLWDAQPGDRAAVFEAERDCRREDGGFVPWEQGFTPKEHREMLDRQKMLDWQASREDADRAWRERQEEKAEKRANTRHWREILIVGLLVGGAAIISQIVAAFIERGSWF